MSTPSSSSSSSSSSTTPASSPASPTGPSSPPSSPSSPPASPTSPHLDLWMLVAALIVGLSMGPLGLKRFAPGAHEAIFVGGAHLKQQIAVQSDALEDQLRQAMDRRERMLETGVSEVAITEYDRRVEREAEAFRAEKIAPLLDEQEAAQKQRHERLMGLIWALLLGAWVLATLRRAVDPRKLATHYRLAAATYACLCVVGALALSHPPLVLPVSWWTGVLVVVIAGVAALVPLGKTR